MLAKRVIPSMLVRGRTLVKGERFNGWRSIGHAAQAARIHAARGVDELMILDISATAEGRGPDLFMVSELSTDCYIPITVGGGVKTLDDIDKLLRAGADKVSICSAATPEFIESASDRFGKQAIVVCIEYRGSPVLAEQIESWGAGEILLSDVDRDGTQQGYNLDLIRQVSGSVGIPVIASGGCAGYQDMLEAFKAGADACAAGALFAFTDATPRGAARFLKANGMEVRL